MVRLAKFKIQLAAYYHVPDLVIYKVDKLVAGAQAKFVIKVRCLSHPNSIFKWCDVWRWWTPLILGQSLSFSQWKLIRWDYVDNQKNLETLRIYCNLLIWRWNSRWRTLVNIEIIILWPIPCPLAKTQLHCILLSWFCRVRLRSYRTQPFLRKQSAKSGIFCIYSSFKDLLLLNQVWLRARSTFFYMISKKGVKVLCPVYCIHLAMSHRCFWFNGEGL